MKRKSSSSSRGGGRARSRPRRSPPRLVITPFTSSKKGFKHEGVFDYVYGDERKLLTKVPDLYTVEALQELTSVPDDRINVQNGDGTFSQYRNWDPFKSNLAAAILGDLSNIWLKPGSRVLYLAYKSCVTISHVSDLVGSAGIVYVVGDQDQNLVTLCRERSNVVQILEDSRHPARYKDRVKRMVDVIISEDVRYDRVETIADNASEFLKRGGKFIMLLRANFEVPFVPDEVEFESEAKALERWPFKIVQQVTLEPFTKYHSCLTGAYLVGNH